MTCSAAGGDTISVTSGVVSRIEVTSYVHGTTELLAIQIDAAINSGNSGEMTCKYSVKVVVMIAVVDGCKPARQITAALAESHHASVCA